MLTLTLPVPPLPPPADRIVPRILFELCSGPMTPAVHLETQQALVKQFADILEFVLKFDEMKVCSDGFGPVGTGQ